MVMLTNAAKRTARRRGYTCYRAVLQGLVARITTAVVRRGARMLLRCLPQCDSDAECDFEPSQQAALRAGDPGTADLPLLEA